MSTRKRKNEEEELVALPSDDSEEEEEYVQPHSIHTSTQRIAIASIAVSTASVGVA